MRFLKKNKMKIFCISLVISFIFGILFNSLGIEANAAEFKIGKVNVNCLNVRCGPGVGYKKIGKIYKNDYIEVLTQLGDWYVIRTENDLIGTVSSKYIDSTSETEIIKKVEQTASSDNEETILDVANVEFSNSILLTEEEQEFLNLINANRRNNGLKDLEIDNEVQNIARLKAEDLVENNYFAHTSAKYGDMSAMLSNANISYKTVGENIAGNNNLVGAVEAWMNSENHKANLLSTEYNYTGVAVVESKLYGKIFVQVFVGK